MCTVADEFDNENWNNADFKKWSFYARDKYAGFDYSKPMFVCAGKKMAGGYGSMGRSAWAGRWIRSLPPHNYLRIKV